MAPRSKRRHDSQDSYAASPRTRKKSRVHSRSRSPSLLLRPADEEEEGDHDHEQPHHANHEQPVVATEGWFEAVEILNEERGKFLISWAGTDPATGRPYEPSWEPKSYANKQLRADWQARKKLQQRLRDPSSGTPDSTPRRGRPRRPRPVVRDDSISPSLASEPQPDQALEKTQPVVDSPRIVGDAEPAASAGASPPAAHCPETPQPPPSTAAQEGSRRSSVQSNIEATHQFGSKIVSSPRRDFDQEHVLHSPQKPASIPNSNQSLSPVQSSQDIQQIEEHENSALLSPPPTRKPTVSDVHGLDIVPDSQGSNFVPSSQSKRTSETGTLIAAEELTSSASKDITKQSLELTSTAVPVSDTNNGQRPDPESDPIEDPPSPPVQSGTPKEAISPTPSVTSASSPPPSIVHSPEKSQDDQVQPRNDSSSVAIEPASPPEEESVSQHAQVQILTNPPTSQEDHSIEPEQSVHDEQQDSPRSLAAFSEPRASHQEQEGKEAAAASEALNKESEEKSDESASQAEGGASIPAEYPIPPQPAVNDISSASNANFESQDSSTRGSGSSLNDPNTILPSQPASLVDQLSRIVDKPTPLSISGYTSEAGSIPHSARDSTDQSIQGRSPSPPQPGYPAYPRLSGIEAAHRALQSSITQTPPRASAASTPSPAGRIFHSIEANTTPPRRRSSSPIPSVHSLPNQAYLNDTSAYPSSLRKLNIRDIPSGNMDPYAHDMISPQSAAAEAAETMAKLATQHQHPMETPNALMTSANRDVVGHVQSLPVESAPGVDIVDPLHISNAPLETDDSGKQDEAESEQSESMEIDQVEDPGIPLRHNEFTIPIPMENIAKSTYRGIISQNRDAISEFAADPESTAYTNTMKSMIEKLRCVELHMDLLIEETDTPSQNAGPENLLNWYSGQNQNFSILRSLLERLMQTNLHIVLAARPGKMQFILETFCRGLGVNYFKFDQPAPLEVPQADSLLVSIIPTSGKGSNITLPRPATAIFLLDSAVDIETPNIQAIRSDPTDASKLAPIISFVVVNSVSHVERCLSTDWNLSPANWLRSVVCLATATRQEVGNISVHSKEGYADPEDSVELVMDFLQSPEQDRMWSLPPLQPVRNLETLLAECGVVVSDDADDASSGPASVQEPIVGQKRPAELELDEPTKRFRPTPQPDTVGGVEEQQTPADVAMQQGHDAHTTDASPSRVSDSHVPATIPASSVGAENDIDVSEEILALRQQLKEKERLLANYSTSLEKVQSENYSFRTKIKEANKARATAEEQATNRLKRIEQQDTTLTTLREERTQLRTELDEMRKLVVNSTVPELADFAKLRIENEELRTAANKAQSAKVSAETNFEFVRGEYQTTQALASEHRSRVTQLEKELAELRPLADGQKTKLHSIYQANITEVLGRENEGLKGQLRELTNLLNRKEEEIRMLKEMPQRQMTTRGSSVPLQRSPRAAPLSRIGSGSRAASPARIAGRVNVLRQE